MANVQLEHGYVRVANRLDEAITFAPFTGTQIKLVRAIVRLSYGWRQKTVRISLADLAARIGVPMSKDGRAPGHVRRALAELVAHGVVIEVDRGTGKRPGALAIRKNFTQWGKFAVDPAALEQLFTPRPDHADEQLPAALAAELQPDLFDVVDSAHDADSVYRVVGPSEDQQDDGENIPGIIPDAVVGPREDQQTLGKLDSPAVVGPSEDQQEPYATSVVGPSEDQQENVDNASWSSQGPVIGPPEDQQTGRNALLGNDLPLRKDRKDRTTTTPAAPARAHARESSPIAGRIGGDIGKLAVTLTVIANQAITERWGEQPAPLVASSGHAYEAAEQLLVAQVPLELAMASIAEQLKRETLQRPPRSLKYLVPGILELHALQDAGQRAIAGGASPRAARRADRARREAPQRFDYANATPNPESVSWQD